MARSDARFSIYPAPKAVEIIGDSAPALNQGVECWGALLMRSIADNAKKFSVSRTNHKVNDVHGLNDWGMLADALKDVNMDPDFPNPGALLAAALEDAHRLLDLGSTWFHAEIMGQDEDENLPEKLSCEPVLRRDSPSIQHQYDDLREKLINELVNQVRELDYTHGWALLLTVRWLWQHSPEDAKSAPFDHARCSIDKQWWTLAGRRKWQEEQTEKSPSRAPREKRTSKRKKKLTSDGTSANQNK